MKRILVPTDFSIRSLNIVHSITAHFNEPLDIILFHAVDMPTRVGDLLFMRQRITKDYIKKDYRDACEILKNKYSSAIVNLRTELFHGSTRMAFNNFLDAREADFIALSDTYEYNQPYEHSIDPLPLIKRSSARLLMLKTGGTAGEITAGQETLSALLLSA